MKCIKCGTEKGNKKACPNCNYGRESKFLNIIPIILLIFFIGGFSLVAVNLSLKNGFISELSLVVSNVVDIGSCKLNYDEDKIVCSDYCKSVNKTYKGNTCGSCNRLYCECD